MKFENNSHYNCNSLAYHCHNFNYLSNKLVTQVESKTVLSTTNKPDKIDFSSEMLFIWMSIAYIIFWLVCQIFIDFKRVKNRSVFTPTFLKSPCRNCKFYNQNSYLKCAVHPYIVLTKQAENCVDYCDKQ